jgi:hypothetical protein
MILMSDSSAFPTFWVIQRAFSGVDRLGRYVKIISLECSGRGSAW